MENLLQCYSNSQLISCYLLFFPHSQELLSCKRKKLSVWPWVVASMDLSGINHFLAVRYLQFICLFLPRRWGGLKLDFFCFCFQDVCSFRVSEVSSVLHDFPNKAKNVWEFKKFSQLFIRTLGWTASAQTLWKKSNSSKESPFMFTLLCYHRCLLC